MGKKFLGLGGTDHFWDRAKAWILNQITSAVGSIINDATTSTSTTWSSEKISADLADKQDFRIFNSLKEFNEKKGTSLTVVSGIDNMKDIVNAMSNGEILIIVTRYETGSEVYFGLDSSTGCIKMFTFIKSNGLCDVECRTSVPLTLKRVLNPEGVIDDWQQLATTSDLSKYYHKCIYAKTNTTGSELVKTLALEDGKCYTIESYQGDNYRRTRVYLFSGTIRTIDEITSQANPFTLSSNDNVLTITFAGWPYNQCRIYEESPANVIIIG